VRIVKNNLTLSVYHLIFRTVFYLLLIQQGAIIRDCGEIGSRSGGITSLNQFVRNEVAYMEMQNVGSIPTLPTLSQTNKQTNIMAEVKFDLAELRENDAKIAGLEKTIAELTEQQRSIVIHHKFFEGKLKLARRVPWEDISKYVNPLEHNVSFRDESITFDVQTMIDRGILRWDIKEVSTKSTKDFINLDDTVRMVKEEYREQYRDENAAYLKQAMEAEREIGRVREVWRKDYDTAKADCIKEIEKKDKQIKLLKEQIEGWKTNFDERVKLYADKAQIIQSEYRSLQQELLSFKPWVFGLFRKKR